MPVIIALVVTFLVGLVPTMRGIKWSISFGISCLIMPAFVLFDAFVLPYKGGGSPMFLFAFIIGGIFGVIAGGLGTAIGFGINKEQKERNQ